MCRGRQLKDIDANDFQWADLLDCIPPNPVDDLHWDHTMWRTVTCSTEVSLPAAMDTELTVDPNGIYCGEALLAQYADLTGDHQFDSLNDNLKELKDVVK